MSLNRSRNPNHAAWERECALAASYANGLLEDLGSGVRVPVTKRFAHPALRWARSGLMALTGTADGEPQMCPAPLTACADGALLALQLLAPEAGALYQLQGAELLSERAALLGLTRNGRTAPGGSCRILDVADGRIAINLAREDDWAMLPAWLETEAVTGAVDDWASLSAAVAAQSLNTLLERGRLLGLAVAEDRLPDSGRPWFKISMQGRNALPRAQPLVLDLSSLWAGPLCSHLLQKLGARVIKLESATRPDGARDGHAHFYHLLNAGKQSVALDLSTETGHGQLRQLIGQADIVIEAARPRGLRQMGLVAEELIAARPGLTWLSITGHGRDGEAGERVGFGDDAAVAGGLASVMEAATGQPMFAGDAIADPLTGLHAALAAWHSHRNGGGRLVSLALSDVMAHCLHFDLPRGQEAIRRRYRIWSSMVVPDDDIGRPQSRNPREAAAEMGEDTESVFKEFTIKQ